MTDAKIVVSEKNPAALTMAASEPPLPPTHPHVGSHQPCCLCAATGHGCGGAVGSVVPPTNNAVVVVNPSTAKNPSLGDIATGMMLATGFAHWGWGYGLGWNRPDKPFIGTFYEFNQTIRTFFKYLELKSENFQISRDPLVNCKTVVHTHGVVSWSRTFRPLDSVV